MNITTLIKSVAIAATLAISSVSFAADIDVSTNANDLAIHGYDAVSYLKQFKSITAAYHISDNNGLEDSNEPFSIDSWFVEHIRKDLNYYSLEIYVSDIKVLEDQYTLLASILR